MLQLLEKEKQLIVYALMDGELPPLPLNKAIAEKIQQFFDENFDKDNDLAIPEIVDPLIQTILNTSYQNLWEYLSENGYGILLYKRKDYGEQLK